LQVHIGRSGGFGVAAHGGFARGHMFQAGSVDHEMHIN